MNNKKILIITQSLAMGGAERVSSTLANLLAEEFEVELATFANGNIDFYSLNRKVKRVELNLDQNSNCFFTGLKNNIIRIYVLRNYIKHSKSSTVIAMMSMPTILTAIACIGLKVKLIGSERSYPPAMPLGTLWESLRKYSYSRLDNLIVLTKESKRWCLKNTLAKSINIIPNPVVYPLRDVEPIVSVDKYIKPGMKVILSVGRLSIEKNQKDIIQACYDSKLFEKGWYLFLVGDGSELESLKRLSEDLEASEHVIFVGKVGNVGNWYKRADIYALTSLFEGFPNTLIEAMSQGTAVISYDCDTGPRDIITNNVDGKLIEPNLGSLTEALVWLAEDETLRGQLGREATKVRERYSIDNTLKKWIVNCFL
ncbi:glycosyltransferase family 4 protein [Shewanella corallii]|uniref:Glycosyltransferase family 4 protein n=1 Tax=Shewanella corallii TaxID=560080 RepID=A0ABT0N403_9GAMM|nr:glycosyltransferase family 4 protein [Shewanella corallii]MCL2913167.1 glycosyltransferase family 4 protein [Shewanella corallii]